MRNDHACTGECKRSGCDCGAILRDGEIIRIGIPLMLKDSATMNPTSYEDRQTMRDRVQGMPLSDAAKLAVYDDVRGQMVSGMPAEQFFAIRDGAVPSGHGNTGVALSDYAQGRADAAREKSITDQRNAWQDKPSESGAARTADAAPDGDAYERSVHRLNNAWKGD